MGRSTFSGPVLAGGVRFGAQRDVGFTLLSQAITLDFSVSTNGATNYGGASGQFVSSVTNNAFSANENATIYTPQAGIPSAAPAVSAPTADATGTNYRGAVFYLPINSTIQEVIIDNIVQPTDGTHAVTGIQPYISNNFATSAGVYATSASITGSSVGRTSATFTATQYGNAGLTLPDVQNIFWPNVTTPAFVSQVVVTLAMTVAALTTVNAGKLTITVRYTQVDDTVGTVGVYPYGNVD
mgnify:CR=1 FL=1